MVTVALKVIFHVYLYIAMRERHILSPKKERCNQVINGHKHATVKTNLYVCLPVCNS